MSAEVVVITEPKWGDGGKCKVVDLLSEGADANVRFNGGPNSGHTVVNNLGKFILHGIPSSILHRDVMSILPSTVVVGAIHKEIEELREKGVYVGPDNLIISPDAPLIMPWHKRRDKLREISRSGKGVNIGTTGQGIGPTYADFTDRVGLRVGYLFDRDFIQKFDHELRFQDRHTRLMDNEV